MILLKKSLPLLHDDTVFIDNGEILLGDNYPKVIYAMMGCLALWSLSRLKEHISTRQLKVWARFPIMMAIYHNSLFLFQQGNINLLSRSLDVQLVDNGEIVTIIGYPAYHLAWGNLDARSSLTIILIALILSLEPFSRDKSTISSAARPMCDSLLERCLAPPRRPHCWT